jgi:hypothetical protein
MRKKIRSEKNDEKSRKRVMSKQSSDENPHYKRSENRKNMILIREM